MCRKNRSTLPSREDLFIVLSCKIKSWKFFQEQNRMKNWWDRDVEITFLKETIKTTKARKIYTLMKKCSNLFCSLWPWRRGREERVFPVSLQQFPLTWPHHRHTELIFNEFNDQSLVECQNAISNKMTLCTWVHILGSFPEYYFYCCFHLILPV